jgi:TonB-dependent receptor
MIDMKRNSLRTTMLATVIAAALSPAYAAAQATAPQAPADATPAAPQDAAAPAPAPQPGTNVRKTPQQSQADAAKATQLSGVVVSTPLQASLQSAQSIKQNAKMVVDSIVAEDIGKLPDNSVADALQRITGVQVAQGFQGETSSVVIRGLPNAVTTLNGREIFNSGGRQFSFQDLPATAVSGLDVYKSTDATMVTGGIAGTVDIRTFHPFDFEGLKVAATETETNQKYGAHTDPTASFLISDRWHTDAGEFGALLNAGITTMHYDYNAAFVDDNLTRVATDGQGNAIRNADGNLLISPNQYGANYNIGYRKRPEANYALQWKPTDNTEVYLEGLYTWISDRYNQPYYFTGPQNVVAPSSFTSGRNCFPVGTQGSPYQGQTACPITSATYTGNYYAATSTQAHEDWGQNVQNSLGLKWHGDTVNLSTDYTRTSSQYMNQRFVIDTYLDAYTQPLTTTYSAPNTWGLAGNPQLNPANYYLNGLYQQWTKNTANQNALKFDGNWSFDAGIFNSLDFGARYADTKARATGAQFNQAPPGGAYLDGGAPNPTNNVLNAFGSSYFCKVPSIGVVPGSALTGCYKYLINNKDALRNYYGLADGRIPAQQGSFFNIGEKTSSIYGQLNYGGLLGDMSFDGVLGMRLEKTDRNLEAYTYDNASALYSPIGVGTSQKVALPNATFNLHITDTLQARLSAGKTIQYPDFSQLNPSLTLTPSTANTVATGSGGNANLKPTKSTSYDATLEWYFSPVGSVTGGVFYHDITGYIENYSFEQNIGGVDYLISGPQSSGAGHLEGAELAYQQFFDFLPGAWSGLGVQANYTYIDSSLSTPAISGDGFIKTQFQNVSKNNGNLALMYEKYGISARLAYNYRSKYSEFFLAASGVLGNNSQMYDKPANQVDLSVSYDISKNFTVVVNATNLFGANFHSYAGKGTSLPQDYRYQDRSVGMGVRFKL